MELRVTREAVVSGRLSRPSTVEVVHMNRKILHFADKYTKEKQRDRQAESGMRKPSHRRCMMSCMDARGLLEKTNIIMRQAAP